MGDGSCDFLSATDRFDKCLVKMLNLALHLLLASELNLDKVVKECES